MLGLVTEAIARRASAVLVAARSSSYIVHRSSFPVVGRALLAVLLLSISAGAQDGLPPLRWSGPPGSRPGTYQQWLARHPVRPFSSRLTYQSGNPGERVALVVEQALAEPLGPDLERLIADLEASGRSVSRYDVTGGTPEALRALLREAWTCDSITGALLIGDLPVPWFQAVTFGSYDEWPTDLFYMDLDNTWSDSLVQGSGDTLLPGSDGIYDRLESGLDVEIYIGRLTPTGMPDRVALLRNYLRKCHRFRTDSMEVADQALAFVDDDWQRYGPQWSTEVGLAYPNRLEYFDPETTRATVYRQKLQTPQAWISVFAHSWPGGHTFKYDSGRLRDNYYGYEYTTQDVPALFYNYFACWFCRYTDSAYGGGQGIFNPSFGLAAIGPTKAGGMVQFAGFYTPLGRGQSIGDSYLQWFKSICSGGYWPSEQAWTLGMTLLGDPFLYPFGQTCDAAVRRILSPSGSLDSGCAVVPQALVANLGSAAGVLQVKMSIGSEYFDSTCTPELTPGESALVVFAAWRPRTVGRILLTCLAVSPGSRNLTNDTLHSACLVRTPDVGVTEILSPAGRVDTLSLLPRVVVRNYDAGAEQCWVQLEVLDTLGACAYRDSTWVSGLSPYAYRTVYLPTWPGPLKSGLYYATAWTVREHDAHPENDTARAAVGVIPGYVLPPGWRRVADLPSGPKNKKVKWGGSLAVSPAGHVYALKGGGTSRFFAYHPLKDTWLILDSIPLYGSAGKKKGVKRGGALVWAGNCLYAVKGNKTLEFWRFRPGWGWSEMCRVPSTWGEITAGAGLAWVGDHVYLLKGSKTLSCLPYDLAGDSWGQDLPVIPNGGDLEGLFDQGSALTGDGDNRLYALKGKYNEFFCYDITDKEWRELAELPERGRSGHSRKAKDGTSIACQDSNVYVLKGGSHELWRYARATRWQQLEDLPASGNKKKAGAGGALVYCEPTGALYALRGANTLELWMYVLPSPHPQVDEPQVASPRTTLSLKARPNPTPGRSSVSFVLAQPARVGIKLFDATGAQRLEQRQARLSAGRHHLDFDISFLPTGIYLLRLDAEAGAASLKLVRR